MEEDTGTGTTETGKEREVDTATEKEVDRGGNGRRHKR
jgi:hypothetical protein